MRLLDQFQRLSRGVAKMPGPGIAEVADMLACSERHARTVLKRMQAEGWLRWQSGLGRGNRSVLTLLKPPEALRLSQLQSLVAEGRLEAAFHRLSPAERQRLRESLPGFLGTSPSGGLRIPFYRPLHGLDPIDVHRRTEAHILRHVCARLVAYDREAGAIVPALAHHWEVDGARWRFWLRPNLRFHDGRPVRAEDAARCLLRLRDEAGAHRFMFAHVKSVRASGNRLDVDLTHADYLFPNCLAHHTAGIVPAGDWQRADFAARPVGAGPFRLVRNNEFRVSLAAFPDYFGPRPLLDEIELWVVPPGSALPRCDVSFAHEHAPPSDWQNLRQLEQGCSFAVFNPARPAFAKSSYRLAWGQWVRDAARPAMELLGQVPAEGYLPGWHHLEKSRHARPKVPATLTIATYVAPSNVALAEQVAARFREAGTQVRLMVLEYPDFVRFHWLRRADVFIAAEVMEDDQEYELVAALAGNGLFRQWLPAKSRRALSVLARRIRAEPAKGRRAELIEDGFARIVADGYLIPLGHSLQSVDFAPRLGGVQLAQCGWLDFCRLWFKEA